MKKSFRPTLIGAFVAGAIIIAMVGFTFLASGVLFKETATFVAYFEESVDGLDVGAPVKFSGIKIGEVTDIGIYASPESTNRYASVTFEIDLEYIRNLGIHSDFTDPKVVRGQVDLGLRVRLELASIVTGVVFIEMEFDEQSPPPVFVLDKPPFPEIPTKRSALAELGQSATEVIARLSAIDAPAISVRLISLLETIDSTLISFDFQQVANDLEKTSLELRSAIAEADIARSSAKFDATMDEIRDVAVLLNEDLEPTLARVDSATRKLDHTLSVLEAAAGDMGEVFNPKAELIVSMRQAMEANQRAMESLRILAETIERNPRVLLTGKDKNRN